MNGDNPAPSRPLVA
ncbi:hypothetical protein [Citrobacter youngae]